MILPPSSHENGTQYRWITRMKPALLPAWIPELLSGPEPAGGSNNGAGDKISEGRRNAALTSMAGSMRRKAMTSAAIEAALLQENKLRCEPPLSDAEVRSIAASVGRYHPGEPEQKELEGFTLSPLRSCSPARSLIQIGSGKPTCPREPSLQW